MFIAMSGLEAEVPSGNALPNQKLYLGASTFESVVSVKTWYTAPVLSGVDSDAHIWIAAGGDVGGP